jgi:hypothetical protein
MRQMESAQRLTLAGIRVVDPQGIVVATTGSELGLSLADREEVQRALSGSYASLTRARLSDSPDPPAWSISRGSDVRVFVALPVIVSGRLWGAVVLSRTPISLEQALYRNQNQLVVGGLIVVALMIAVSVLSALVIGGPVRRLIRQAERMGRGDLEAAVPLAHPGTAEVAQLSTAFADMSRNLAVRKNHPHLCDQRLARLQDAADLDARCHRAAAASVDRDDRSGTQPVSGNVGRRRRVARTIGAAPAGIGACRHRGPRGHGARRPASPRTAAGTLARGWSGCDHLVGSARRCPRGHEP